MTRYVVAIGAAAAALLLYLTLTPIVGLELPFMVFYPAIMLSAWSGGLCPGIVTTVISAISVAYVWIEPRGSWAVGNPADMLGLLLFMAIGVVISALNEAWRRGAAALAASEARERKAHEQTERARSEAERSALQLRAALEAGRLGTWHYTIGTGDVKWSPGLEAIHGFSPGTFAGTFEEFRNEIHPADRARVLEAIGAAVQHRRDHHVEYRIIRRDGAVRWVEGVGQVLCDETGQPAQMVGVCSDITDRKHVDEERAQLLARERMARAEMEQASRLKDEFLAVLSHELRTPLNAVVGYAHLLNGGTLPPERAHHAVEAIQRNAQAQTRLVESLLDLSRILAGKLELDIQPLDLSRIVDAALDVIRPDADAKGVRLEVVEPRSPVSLSGDGGRLQQVFWNLLSNAVKFTPPPGRVAIGWTAQDGHVRIELTDSGQGISADFLPYVFDRFKQAEGPKRSGAGLGLGLTLVREMVHAHGGTIVAESPGEGRGSTFVITLPLSADGQAVRGETGQAAPADTRESLAHIEILIVDDDADVRHLLALMLESRGAITHLASSAAEALQAIDEWKPDVLLADLRMPEEDGYSLIRNVRARERVQGRERLPAIAVTASASVSDREHAVTAGYDGHVAKPVEPEDLARAITRARRAARV